MKAMLAGAMIALGAPAYAGDVAITMWNTSDIAGAITATGPSIAGIGPANLDGVTVSQGFVQANYGSLVVRDFDISNTANTMQTLRILAGGDAKRGGFFPLATDLLLGGSVFVELGGVDVAGSFFIDPAGGLSGLTTNPVGADIKDFDSGPLVGPHMFSFGDKIFDNLGPNDGASELLSLTLSPGASLRVGSLSLTGAVPEPSTWAMMLGGFGLMALFGWRKRLV